MDYRKFLDRFPHRHIDSGGILDAWTIGKSGDYCLEVGTFKGGRTYGPHHHPVSAERILFVRGNGYFFVGNKRVPYRPGTILNVPKGVEHKLEARDATILLSLQNPPIFNPRTGENDIRHA